MQREDKEREPREQTKRYISGLLETQTVTVQIRPSTVSEGTCYQGLLFHLLAVMQRKMSLYFTTLVKLSNKMNPKRNTYKSRGEEEIECDS